MRFFDAHCDAVMRSYDGPFDFIGGDSRGHVDLPRLLAAGHCVQVFAIFAVASYYRGHDLAALAERAIGTIRGWVEASAGRVRLALSAADVRGACAEDGREAAATLAGVQGSATCGSRAKVQGPISEVGDPIAALIGLEGADPLEGRAENLARFFDLGVRLVIPAWDDNAFSGSAFGSGSGLTAEGARLIELCQALGVMVDVSHASDTAFDQICQITKGPFIASHSNCRALSPAGRNLTDAQIRSLAGRGGVMGINLAPDFLSPDYHAAWEAIMAPVRAAGLLRSARNDADAAERQKRRQAAGPQLAAIPRPGLEWVARHVQHAMAVGGEACVGLGGDLDGISFMPDGVEGVESYPAIVEALRAAGLTERQVELVCWRNMARVFVEVLP